MKKTKNLIITGTVIITILVLGIFIYRQYFHDENRLSIKEREWIEQNKSTVITVNIPNDLNVFGHNGAGVFFDFFDALVKQTNISINKNVTSIKDDENGLGFFVSKEIKPENLRIYQDHYILVGKNEEVVSSFSEVKNNKIGVLGDTLASVGAYYDEPMTYNNYNGKAELVEALKSDAVKYIIVPKVEYLDAIISNNFRVIFHFSDLLINYYLRLGDDEILNSIITKHYNDFLETDLANSYYEYSYDLYIEKLGLTQAEADTLTNKTYNYGFVPSAPYQTLTSSKYGGIAISYLTDFSKLTKAEFTYSKYQHNNTLIKNFNNKKLDIIFNDTNIDSNYYQLYTNFNNKYYIIAPLVKRLNLKNIKELVNEQVLVLENSLLYKQLSTVENLDIKTVPSEKELVKMTKKGKVIAIDANTFDYYINNQIKGYNVRYTGYISSNHSFKYVNNEDAFYKMFNAYTQTLDQSEMINNGLINYEEAAISGNVIANIAKYTLALSVGGLAVLVYLYFKKNRIKLNTKIRKDDKLKFVDMLTSLKNRNYLNEKKEVWNQNTIYPQAIIVIDLNNVKYLNDTFGHEDGDKQIKAAANSLIKTQLDNSEIMRTDGNEFTVYLVGYNEKQVLNYLKKLVKEFKDLPYEYGAAFGFSMIVDDLKLIDDAISEASMQMRDNKENLEAKHEDKSLN